MTTIIDDLYYGKINPDKETQEYCENFRKTIETIFHGEPALFDQLTGEPKKAALDLIRIYSGLVTQLSAANFQKGFRMGAQLMAELFANELSNDLDNGGLAL